jgi:hypothetical protein
VSYRNITPLNRRLIKSIQLLKPPPKQTVSEWAVEHRILSAEASAESGKYNLARAPFQKGWQDAISDPRIHTIVGMTSAQVGKTETFLNNPVGYFIAQDPAPTWTLYYVLQKTGTRITFNSSQDGSSTNHLVSLTPATTAGYTVGLYHWVVEARDGTDVYVVDEGYLEIKTDYAEQSSGYDDRSVAKKMVDAYECEILFC